MLQAWFDGACEPVNPGGLGTYGFVVDDAKGKELVAEGGILQAVPPQPMTNNIAEYQALIRLLGWLVEHRKGKPVEIRGDSKLVVMQVLGEWKSSRAYLTELRDEARRLLVEHGGVKALLHVPREQNGRADELTHDAYVDAMAADSVLRARFLHALAGESLWGKLEAAGIEPYPFIGRREALRLLSKKREADKAGPAAESEED